MACPLRIIWQGSHVGDVAVVVNPMHGAKRTYMGYQDTARNQPRRGCGAPSCKQPLIPQHVLSLYQPAELRFESHPVMSVMLSLFPDILHH